MKAVTLSQFGKENALSFNNNHPQPKYNQHQVLIKVKACALGGLDIQVREGHFKDFQDTPIVPGYEISGVIEAVGSSVDWLAVGDEVVAITPLDSASGGYAEYSVQNAVDVAKKPDILSHEEAAAALLPGLRAYTAFHYLANVKQNDFLLFCTPQNEVDTITVQLAGLIGLKVIVTVSTTEELNLYADCGNHVVRVVDITTENLVETVLSETAGLGVQCVLDLQHLYSDKKSQDREDDEKTPSTSKKDLIKCLGVHSTWITTDASLQLDPPDSLQLFYRSSKLAYLFDQAWLMAPSKQGRYIHILRDLMEKMSKGNLKPPAWRSFALEKIRSAHRELASKSKGAAGRIILKM